MAKIFDVNHLQRLLNEYLKRIELAFLGIYNWHEIIHAIIKCLVINSVIPGLIFRLFDG